MKENAMHSGKPAVSAVLLALLCLTLFSLAGCASSQSPQGPVPASSALPQQEAGDASSVFVEVKSSDNSFNSDLASLVASTLQSDHGINPADSRKEADITIDITVNDVYLAASSGRRISGSQALGTTAVGTMLGLGVGSRAGGRRGALIGAGAGALLGLSASAADAKSENTWAMKSTVTMQKKSGEPVTKEHAVTASGRGMDRSSALHALEDKLAQDISAAYGK